MRHSEPFKPTNINNSDSLQQQNEKWPLTISGEKRAEQMSQNRELSDFDIVVSSHYVRAIATAKYFAKDKVLVDESFGERKFGVNTWKELPQDFERKQFTDFDYHLETGESLNDVIKREYHSLTDILNQYGNKKVLIVGHATAFTALFYKWCGIENTNNYVFHGHTFFDGKWDYCETFKLEFDNDNKLISIENMKVD